MATSRNLAAMADAVHAHGALAGVELWHGGSYVANLATRVPTSACARRSSRTDPVQSQRMDRRDIRDFRRWHREAALRARRAGFDIVYVYPTHGYLLSRVPVAQPTTTAATSTAARSRTACG